VPTAALVRTALEAAGEDGLTARELANLTDMPTGTASGRLSVMKQQGMVMHITPKYFAVHSQPQDNNQ
jgi:DNA-binding IclR family transcriptional regulator